MNNEDETIVIIGGGVIGAMCAWYLRQSGHSVTIVDRDRFGAACSHGNCGFVSPSHVLPLTQPGVVSGTLKSLFSSNSPLRIKPRFSPALWRWLFRFTRRCNKTDMLEAGAARHALLQSSRRLLQELIETEGLDVEWQTDGLLFVHATRQHFEEYAKIDELLRAEFGVGAEPYPGEKLVDFEPSLKPGVGGGWLYRQDAWLRADRLMSEMKSRLQSAGVTIRENCPVDSIAAENGRGRAVETPDGPITAKAIVVATGALTPFLNKVLGCRVPIQPGKGYSITMPRPKTCPRLPMIFEQHRVAITPMLSGYRIGSTMEFAGYDTSVNPKRLNLLRSGAEHYLITPLCDPVEEEWYGWRPMTWDGKPFIDRAPALRNVWVAAGHNMLGLSMAAGTGKLISELINNEPPHVEAEAYSFRRLG